MVVPSRPREWFATLRFEFESRKDAPNHSAIGDSTMANTSDTTRTTLAALDRMYESWRRKEPRWPALVLHGRL
jgi:hypothetical protein